MTLAVRVIPCLDVDAGRVVKGVNFQGLRDAGDPVELAKKYDEEGADELTFLDISASHEGRATTLEIVSATSGNRVIMKAVDSARDSVREGNTLAEPLGRFPVFPPMVVKMIAIGERSGALESLLEKISIFYDEQVEQAVKSLTSLIEPLMIGAMGFMVGTIVMAVFWPIMDLQKALM